MSTVHGYVQAHLEIDDVGPYYHTVVGWQDARCLRNILEGMFKHMGSMARSALAEWRSFYTWKLRVMVNSRFFAELMLQCVHTKFGIVGGNGGGLA